MSDNSLSSYLGYISFLFNSDIQIIIDEKNKNNYEEIIDNYKPNYIWCKKEYLSKPYLFKYFPIIFISSPVSIIKTGLSLLINLFRKQFKNNHILI